MVLSIDDQEQLPLLDSDASSCLVCKKEPKGALKWFRVLCSRRYCKVILWSVITVKYCLSTGTSAVPLTGHSNVQTGLQVLDDAVCNVSGTFHGHGLSTTPLLLWVGLLVAHSVILCQLFKHSIVFRLTVLTEVPQAEKANPYLEYLCISVKILICPFQGEGMWYSQLATKWLCGYLKGWYHIRDLALWLAVWRFSDSLGKRESMLCLPCLFFIHTTTLLLFLLWQHWSGQWQRMAAFNWLRHCFLFDFLMPTLLGMLCCC